MNGKSEIYEQAAKEIAAVLEGETNIITQMATVSCLLSQAFEAYYWTGFYMVDPSRQGELVVGPYQGTLGCLRIPFGRGVCGAAAVKQQTMIVENVNQFDGHIACDSRSVSEIVVPVLDKKGELIAVFDVDSTEAAAFDETDRRHLEAIMADVFGRGSIE